MRTDLTVRTTTGVEHDVAVLAPVGSTWQTVAPAVDAVAGAPVRCCDHHELRPDFVLGEQPLVTGGMLTPTPLPAAPTGARIDVVGGYDCGRSVALTDGMTIGRDASCDLTLTDPRLSRRHAIVSLTPTGAVITDLASTTGLQLADGRVRSTALDEDRPIRLGANLIAVTGGRPQPAPAAPRDVVVPDPPEPGPAPARMPSAAVVLPIVLAAVFAWLSGSWEFLAFAALGPFGGVTAARTGRRRARHDSRRADEQYRQARERAEVEIARGLHAETLLRRREHPHPAEVIRNLGTPRERADLVVRVGLGTADSRLRAVRAGLARAAGPVRDVPVTVDLAAGPLGLAGPDEVITGLARWLVAQLAAKGVRPRFVPEPAESWRWLRWLPPAAEDVVIVRVDDARQLPVSCVSSVVLVDEAQAAVLVRSPSAPAVVALVDRVDPAWCEELARAVAGRTQAATSGVPARCRFGDLIPLHENVLDRWARADGSARTPIGSDATGTLVVDLDRDGPHALIAGSTGSGKSELLQCLVTGLALSCPPDQLTLLLLDYKGGAAFADCARLPHTVGVVTDLDEQLTRRVLASLDSEIRRRERLLAGVGAADLAAYRRSAVIERLARLVIVVDEFATLAEEHATFVTGLVGIARRGRSLGLHLVLATQRPAGVVSPEIRANCALRICLRVTDAADSLDVVDSDAAALISPATPGRAYLRRAGRATEVQIATVGGAVDDDEVRVVLLDDAHRLPDDVDRETELQRAVTLIHEATTRCPAEPHRPWLPPLPECIDLTTLPASAPSAVVIGLVDRPAEQAQPPLTLDLSVGGAVVVSGRGGSGRTTALTTIARAATSVFDPVDLQLHGVDAAGSGLAGLRGLPHVGTLASLADGIEYVAAVVARLADQPSTMANLILVDGWDQLLAASEEYDGGRTADRLLSLARDASSAVTTIVLAGGRATLAPRVAGVGATRFLLAPGDPGDHLAAGLAASAVPHRMPPGRAVRADDGAEIQFACSTEPVTDLRAPGPALRLRPLPRRVTLAGLAAPPGTICLGVGGDQAAPIAVDLLSSAARLLVAGPPRSGRTTLLQTVLAQLDSGCAVVAPPRSLLAGSAHDRHVPVVPPGASRLPPARLLLVDDLDQFVDTTLGEAIDDWLADDTRAAVLAGRTDALGSSYRGLLIRLRSGCCGIVLHPAPGDPAVLGIAVPGSRAIRPPGRGVLVPDPGWALGVAPIPIQVARVEPVASVVQP